MAGPIDALSRASTRVRAVLFQPFDVANYVVFALLVWLSRLGSASANAPGRFGGGGPVGTPPTPEWDPTASREWQQAAEWLVTWGALVGLVVGIGILFAVAIWIALAFVQTRAAFLVVRGLVTGRAEVAGPWRELADEANRLFRFRLVVGLCAGAASLLAITLTGYAILTSWTGWPLTQAQIAWATAAGLVVGPAAFVVAFVDFCAFDFVVPVMVARRCLVGEAFSAVWKAFRADLAGFAGYALIRAGLTLGVGVLGGVLACATCGLVLLPFLGTLILLPVLLFVRAYSVEFVAGLADDLGERLRHDTA